MTTAADRAFPIVAALLDHARYRIAEDLTAFLVSLLPEGFDIMNADDETIAHAIAETARLYSRTSNDGSGNESRKRSALFHAILGGILGERLSQADARISEEG